MNNSLSPCPICELPCEINTYLRPITTDSFDSIKSIYCLRCGRYEIKEESAIDVNGYLKTREKRLNASSTISEITRLDYLIDHTELERLSTVKPPSIDEKALNILLILSESYPTYGTGPRLVYIKGAYEKGNALDIDDFNNEVFITTYKLLSKSWSGEKKEMEYLIDKYLIGANQFLSKDASGRLEISPKGWSKISELKTTLKDSNIGFIAMKFDDKLIKYSRDWFETAITGAGYEAKAMYSHKHTNIIDNEMKALIRRTKFVICDLTVNSRGAYYEAGFAHGLGRPVIFLCESNFFHKKDNQLGPESDGVHFDTNHYPFLEWQWGEGEKLKKELMNWIEGTIGRGSGA